MIKITLILFCQIIIQSVHIYDQNGKIGNKNQLQTQKYQEKRKSNSLLKNNFNQIISDDRRKKVFLFNKKGKREKKMINLQNNIIACIINLLLIRIFIKNHMKLLKPSYFFASQKYFQDHKYMNLSLYSENKVGFLTSIAEIFSKMNINLTFAKTQAHNSNKDRRHLLSVSIPHQSESQIQQISSVLLLNGVKLEKKEAIQVPWFPKRKQDLNLFGQVLLEVNEESHSNHPQFIDPQYRSRREFIGNISKKYKVGDTIPDVPYTSKQTEVWKIVYEKLRKAHRIAACEKFETSLTKLEKEFNMTQRIPQLKELSQYLKSKTGFTLKPTYGILSQREFLNALAFKIFCCTQYIRHPAGIDYTPQPDVMHEICGHVPMFADEQVAEVSHQIGLMSLGASDKQIAQLGAIYWCTIQFGVAKEGKKHLAYGAGITSCVEEMMHVLSDKAKFKKLEPEVDSHDTFPVRSVQELYRVTEDFEQALEELQKFGNTIEKPINTTFNFETETIDYDRNIECIDFGDKGPKF